MKRLFFLMLLVVNVLFLGCQANERRAQEKTVEKRIIFTALANLRGKPVEVPAGLLAPALSKNIGCQETQVLFGETVIVDQSKSNDEWLKVRAEDQLGFVRGAWKGYLGYLKKADTCPVTKNLNPNLVITSFGATLYEDSLLTQERFPLSFATYLEGALTADGVYAIVCPQGEQCFIAAENVTSLERVRGYTEQEIRDKVLTYAQEIKGIPYIWGGRSMMKPWTQKDLVIGVECSSLVNLLFRACGIDLPRNSGSQFLKTFPLAKGADLKKGDLIFTDSLKHPGKIGHVALCSGEELVLHSSGRGFENAKKVPNKLELALCEESSEKLLGARIQDLNSGDKASGGEWAGKRVFFRSVFDQAKDLVEVVKLDPTIVVDMPYAREDNFTKHPVYSMEKAALHKEVADALLEAQKEFATHGYGIKIWDGYRPFSVAQIFWDLVPDPRYCADPRKGSKHSRGAAIDMTLVNLSDGSELEMPTEFDNFTIQAHSHATKDISKTAIKNRQLLRRVMESHGFDVEPTEWWHFNFRGWQKFAVLDIPLEDIK